MKCELMRRFKVIGLILMFFTMSAHSGEQPWELIVVSAYDPSMGGKHITISRTNLEGIFQVSMDAPSYFSWRDIDSEGQHPAPQKTLDLFLGAWNMMYESKWTNAELLITNYANKQSKVVAIRMGPPTLSLDHKSLRFRAKFKANPSLLLASLNDSDQTAGLAKTMPVGNVQGQITLWVENATQTPHDLLSHGIRFSQRKLKVPANTARAATAQRAAASPMAASLSQTVLNTSSSNLIKPTGDCEAEVLTKGWVLSYVSARPDVSSITTSWGGKLTPDDKLAVARAYMLPCEPKVGDSDVNVPENVKLVKGILTKARWDDLTTQMTKGDAAILTTAERASYSYDNFLRAIGKYPFFCGEQGVYTSLEEACRRELATVFAHAAQETGAHDPNLKESDGKTDLPQWKQAFSKVFEGNCYNTGCNTYDPDFYYLDSKGEKIFPNAPCPVGYTCTGHYYGRGAKQISYFYNYMGFSGQTLGNPQELLTNPDAVGKNGFLGLGSGIWFYMTPQPPKPSMHDVITGGGGWHPSANQKGIDVSEEPYVAWDGTNMTGINPTDKFMTTISVINGGVECSPFDKADNPALTAAENQAKKKQAQQQAINRMVYYANLLDYFTTAKTTAKTELEKSYLTNSTGCTIALGNPFTDTSLSYSPLWYVTKDRSLTPPACVVQGWQPLAPFSIVSESSYDICLNQPDVVQP